MISGIKSSPSFMSTVILPSAIDNLSRGNQHYNNLIKEDNGTQVKLKKEIKKLEQNGENDVVTITSSDWSVFPYVKCINLSVTEKRNGIVYKGEAMSEFKPQNIAMLYEEAKEDMSDYGKGSLSQYIA